jgi:ankyrin repeat protein
MARHSCLAVFLPFVCWLALVAVATAQLSLRESPRETDRFSVTAGWQASEIFKDPAVIELCDAIQRDDLAKVTRLIEAGVNLKAVGKNGATPLMWCVPDRDLKCLRLLLENGADPNVKITSDFGYDKHLGAGMSVTYLAGWHLGLEDLRLLLDHGGDPDTVYDRHKKTLLAAAAGSPWAALEKVKLLVERGADLDALSGSGRRTVLQSAYDRGGFKIVLYLLQNGADPFVFNGSGFKLAHSVASESSGDLRSSPEYLEIRLALLARGESLKKAKREREVYEMMRETRGGKAAREFRLSEAQKETADRQLIRESKLRRAAIQRTPTEE